MAFDLLMDDSIKLVTLLGPAGTGKTFIALLAGLHKVMKTHTYRKFLISRPVVALGADLGYLPGDVQEKLFHWMGPVYDNLEFIFNHMNKGNQQAQSLGENSEDRRHRKRFEERKGGSHHGGHGKDHGRESYTPKSSIRSDIDRLQEKGILSLEAITYMRGRSIPNQFVFIDEVQNLTPHEVKTIVSRAGEGTKVILAGDPYQIDSPYLDFTSNGLTVTSEKFKNNDLFGTAFLETSERSELAKLAAAIL
jgi:PhoH-like ATPase